MDAGACEIAFANSAYLSELWAVRDLVRIKKLSNDWTDANEEQLQDEVRHARRLLDFLKGRTRHFVADLAYSMQERLYRPHIDLACSANLAEACTVHDVTERRAAWIYKTFLRVGSDQTLKEISREILDDEKRHAGLTSSYVTDLALFGRLKDVDRKLFRKEIPVRFGPVLIHSDAFWTYYFEGSKQTQAAAIEAEFAAISERQDTNR